MKKIAIVLTGLVLISTLIGVADAKDKLSTDQQLGNGWIIQKISSGDSLVTLEVKALINSSPSEVWKLLTDIDRWKDWEPMLNIGKAVSLEGELEKNEMTYALALNCPAQEVNVSDTGKTVATVFEEYDIPWPIQNDWVIRKYIFDANNSDSGEYKVKFHPVFSGVEKKRGGRYKLSRYKGADEETLLEYDFTVKRKEGCPKTVFEIIMKQTAERFVRAIRRNTEL